jgi:hypothetical protein
MKKITLEDILEDISISKLLGYEPNILYNRIYEVLKTVIEYKDYERISFHVVKIKSTYIFDNLRPIFAEYGYDFWIARSIILLLEKDYISFKHNMKKTILIS